MPIAAMKRFEIRNTQPSDQPKIVGVVKAWWGGRDLSHMLPRLFFIHFRNTSFVVEDKGRFIAFLVGFLSQSRADEGYIHFVGVHPDFRRQEIGRFLYRRFFDVCLQNGRRIVRSCTSPVNRGSVAFHRGMGFAIEAGDGVVDGVAVTFDYNRPGDPKILFKKVLAE
jgi:GNAT superfamily N-acetyltransferase